MRVEIKNLSVEKGEKKIIDSLSLDLDLTGITAISGPSGCGKTTLLRAMCGLEKKYTGTIEGINPLKTGFLFQENRLFPWRTALEHITDVLPKSRRTEADKFLRICELENEKDSFPKSLSGGMARRLALARVLALEAELLVLDEPFAAIDDACTLRIIERIRELGVPTIVVSHRETVCAQADRQLRFSGIPLILL